MQTLTEATVAAGKIDCYPNPVQPVVIRTGYSKINQWLGTDLFGPEIRKYLERVSMTVEETGDAIKVTVPSFRRDITHMADLAEEIARLFGYDRIPVTLPPTDAIGERTPFQQFKHQLRQLLQGNGLSEIITYSLYAKDTPDRLGIPADDPLRTTVNLMVPLSEEQAVMRTTLTHHMLETLAFNVKRRQTDLAFYEIARIYLPQPDSVLPVEPDHLAIGLIGRRDNTGWNQSQANVDFYDLKGYLELILDRFNVENIELKPSKRSYLHPGQSTEIFCYGKPLGFLGRIHPRIIEEYGLSQPAFLMEIDLQSLAKCVNSNIIFKVLPKFPAMERDLALVLPLEIQPNDVIEHIKELGGELVEQVELFDVYQGEQVPDGMRSLAFSLTYRAKDRTLNEAEVSLIQNELLKKLNQIYGAKIRE
jgi:phenylalanyl-tRNA synthetase beta chain